MSQTNTPSESQPTYQFQFNQPVQYPMSQAQVNYVQQPSTPAAQAASSTPQPAFQTPATTPLVGTSSMTTVPASSQPTSGQSQAATTQPAPQQSRSAAEQARKDRTLAEFMLLLDEHEPLIPNEVTDYFLQRVGFESEDVRLKRLLALAAQKFVSDIAADAFQHARIRTNAAASGRGRAPLGQSSRDKTRTTLTMEDLSAALAEYGINARKPDFYM